MTDKEEKIMDKIVMIFLTISSIGWFFIVAVAIKMLWG